MIGRLRGVVLEKQPPHLLLDVHGRGRGFALAALPADRGAEIFEALDSAAHCSLTFFLFWAAMSSLTGCCASWGWSGPE